MTDQKSWTVVKEEFVLFNNVVLNRTWQIMFQNFFQNWMQFYWFTTRRQSFCFKRKSFLNRSSAESRFPHHHCWVSEIICRAAVCYKSSSLHHQWSKAVRKASGGICLRFHIWDLDLLRLIYHHFFPLSTSHTHTLSMLRVDLKRRNDRVTGVSQDLLWRCGDGHHTVVPAVGLWTHISITVKTGHTFSTYFVLKLY